MNWGFWDTFLDIGIFVGLDGFVYIYPGLEAKLMMECVFMFSRYLLEIH